MHLIHALDLLFLRLFPLVLLACSLCCEPAGAAPKIPPPPVPPSCSEPAKGISLLVPEYTGYKPGQGWPNGSCNGGASRHRGITACTHTLDKYIRGSDGKGKKPAYIHVAAQQQGGSAAIFGCWGRTDGFELRKIPKGVNSCHILAIGDRYARSENEGSRGVNGKIQGVKVDIEVDPKSTEFSKLGHKKKSNIECISRIFGMTNREKPNGPRTIKRNGKAQAPMPASKKRKNQARYQQQQASQPLWPV